MTQCQRRAWCPRRQASEVWVLTRVGIGAYLASSFAAAFVVHATGGGGGGGDNVACESLYAVVAGAVVVDAVGGGGSRGSLGDEGPGNRATKRTQR